MYFFLCPLKNSFFFLLKKIVGWVGDAAAARARRKIHDVPSYRQNRTQKKREISKQQIKNNEKYNFCLLSEFFNHQKDI